DPVPPANSPPNAAWINDPDTVSDKYLYSPEALSSPSHLRIFISRIVILWRTGLTAACWRSASTAGHSKTFLQLAAALSGAVTMARSAPVVAIPLLVARRGRATRVVSSTPM